MKTKHLDNEIQRLSLLKRNNELTDLGIEMLNEFIAIQQEIAR